MDQVASLLPLLAVAMFAMAVVSAIGYLRMEEWHTENQTLQRDGEYSRQRISVPYGRDWYKYSVRRLKENPSITGHTDRTILGIGPAQS